MLKTNRSRERAGGETTRLKPSRVSILIVDDDDSVLSEVSKLLAETFQMFPVIARSSADALRMVGSTRFDMALVDWRLGEEDDGIILGRSLWRNYRVPFVLFSGFLDTEVTGNAFKSGAADVIDKPIRRGRLLTAVKLALGHRDRAGAERSLGVSSRAGHDSISRRWAKMALRACHAEDDPKTEVAIAEACGVSTSIYRRDCDECGIAPRNGRDLIRLLRANGLAQGTRSTLRSYLGTLDPRTVRLLFARAGFSIESGFIPLREFFSTQRLISPTKECLHELAHMAANDPLFCVASDID